MSIIQLLFYIIYLFIYIPEDKYFRKFFGVITQIVQQMVVKLNMLKEHNRKLCVCVCVFYVQTLLLMFIIIYHYGDVRLFCLIPLMINISSSLCCGLILCVLSVFCFCCVVLSSSSFLVCVVI